MIDMQRKRKSLFGSQPFNPDAMPAGMGAPIHQMIAPTQQAQAPQREKVKALGVFSDFLSGVAGGQANYANGLHNRRAQAAQIQSAQQLAEAKRLAGREDFMFKEDYKRENAAPKVNDTVEDFNWYKSLSPEDRAIYEQMRPQYRQGADGQFYRIETGGQGPQVLGETLPEGWTIQDGGAGSNASGGFPKG